MKKIGIITLYSDSCNYGGLLQAYALVDVLNSKGYDAKQIQVAGVMKALRSKSILVKIKEKGVRWTLNSLRIRLSTCLQSKKIEEIKLEKVKELCNKFREDIPHTEYIEINALDNLNDEFDLFVVGSDQVWNPKYMLDIFYLTFAKKRKISYAASISVYDITSYSKKKYKDYLRDFGWVSVREEQAVSFLESEIGIKSDLVLDPVMLLSKEQWENEEEEIYVRDKYVFCYFLKGNNKKRLFAQKFGQKVGLKLVYPICVTDTISYDNEKIGEEMLYDVGPRQWLYLLHHAEYVLTDSFHGTVFSIIFNKQFYHLIRDNKDKYSMNSRILSLLKMFGLERQLGDEVNNFTQINYEKINRVLENKKFESLKLLIDALEK